MCVQTPNNRIYLILYGITNSVGKYTVRSKTYD